MGGSKDKTTTQTSDPWATMPDWMKESYQNDTAFREEMLGAGSEIAGELADNPREVLGPSDGEKTALDTIRDKSSEADAIAQKGLDLLGGNNAREGDNFRDADNQSGLDNSSGIDNTYGDANYDSGVAWEDQYTDDVVDTTLAGMDRQAQREAMRRESAGAAAGGTSNSRTAVGNAVADQLTGMNMAEMEAGLRSDATKWGQEGAFRDWEASEAMKRGDWQYGNAMDREDFQYGNTADRSDFQFGAGLDQSDFQFGTGMDQSDFQFEKNQGLKEAGLYDGMAGSHLSRGGALASAESGYGELERNLRQQQLDSNRTSGQEAMSWLGNLYSGTSQQKGPVGSTSTTTVPGPSTFSQILGAATSVAGAFVGSDEGMKENFGDDVPGLSALRDVTPQTYEYREGFGHRTDRHAGLIAQDLGKIPGAVRTGSNGFKEVDPWPVMATVVQAVRELDAKMERH